MQLLQSIINRIYSLEIMLIAMLISRHPPESADLRQQVLNTEGLVAFWDFKEPSGELRKAEGLGDFPLSEATSEIAREKGGPFGFAARFDSAQYLILPWSKTGPLNIYGQNQGVTVMAWVMWSGKVSSFIGGMWNEYQDGGKRQYGLFIDLPHYNGSKQVCGHVASTGKPTPPFPYSIDYSASAQEVAVGQWVCIAFTYDGQYVRSYYNGQFEEREAERIAHTSGFDGFPNGLTQSKNPYFFPEGLGNNGSDFTVGAVLVKGGMGNYYKGLLGGLAIFNRALDSREVESLSVL